MPLSFTRPPLTMNQRLHHYKRAQITKSIRDEVHTRARHMRLPQGLAHITVALHYQAPDRRRRDADNLVPTLKACCDALAAGTTKHPGFGMVADDTPDQMTKPMPTIHPASDGTPAKCWLTIETQETR
jgi:crossover junction endodeoxyribonuclease RusA